MVAFPGGSYFGITPPILMAGKIRMPPHLPIFDILGSVTLTAARYYFYAVYVDRPTTFAGAKFYNFGAGDNGKKVKVAIYNELSTGGPGTLAKDFGESTLTGAAAIRTLASSWSAQPGWYYMALTSDTAPVLSPMSAFNYVTTVGWSPPANPAGMLGAFHANLLAASGIQAYAGDYVAGTYANFPEATALVPTTSLYSAAAYSATTGQVFPFFALYT